MNYDPACDWSIEEVADGLKGNSAFRIHSHAQIRIVDPHGVAQPALHRCAPRLCQSSTDSFVFFFFLSNSYRLFIHLILFVFFFLRCRPDWASASTYFIPEGPAEPEPVAAWIIAVSSVAGILLLSAAIFLLHRVKNLVFLFFFHGLFWVTKPPSACLDVSLGWGGGGGDSPWYSCSSSAVEMIMQWINKSAEVTIDVSINLITTKLGW